MKKERISLPNLVYIAAFVIGIILFASVWEAIGSTGSSAAVLAGLAGVVVAVMAFRIWNDFKNQDPNDE